MTYNVFGGTLNLAQLLNLITFAKAVMFYLPFVPFVSVCLLATSYKTTDWIFTKILSEMYR